jgi:hypothetical protein
MATAARLPLAAWRNELCVRTIRFVGLDLTGVDMRAQIRLRPDAPGVPLISLATVTTAAAEGLKLNGVSVTAGVPSSEIVLRINKATMTDATKAPYGGESGADTALAYAIQLGGISRVVGQFIVLANVMDSDAAPTGIADVAHGCTTSGMLPWSAAQLTFSDTAIEIKIDGVELLAPLVVVATDAAERAEAALAAAEAVAAPLTGLAQSVRSLPGGLTPSANGLDIVDTDGRIMLAFGGDGLLADSHEFVTSVGSALQMDGTRAAIGRLPRLTAVPRIAAGYAGLSGAGQSNMSGTNSGPLTTVQAFNNKRSVNVTGAGALVPLVESGVETSLSGATAQASDLLLRRVPQWAAYNLDWVVNNMGSGGQPYSAITKNGSTTLYADGLARVSAAKARANVEGKAYSELALLWHHGESDAAAGMPRATYKACIKEFRTDWNTDARAVTGQSFGIPMFITQVACGSSLTAGNTGTALAMLDAAEEEADIFVIAPGYIATFISDGLHYNSHDQRMFGAIEGKMLDRYYQDGKSPSTVRPIAMKVLDKRTFEIEFFVPVPPLRWDIDWVWPGDMGLGFAVYNAAGGAELVMACSPQIIGNKVRIRMAADLPAGWRYTYATKPYPSAVTGGLGAGRRKGPRGNLCDSDRTTSFYSDAYGAPYRLPNFCAIFDKTGA